MLHSSVARRDEVWLSPATGALPCGGTSTLPWPTPPCSAPGHTAAPHVTAPRASPLCRPRGLPFTLQSE